MTVMPASLEYVMAKDAARAVTRDCQLRMITIFKGVVYVGGEAVQSDQKGDVCRAHNDGRE